MKSRNTIPTHKNKELAECLTRIDLPVCQGIEIPPYYLGSLGSTGEVVNPRNKFNYSRPITLTYGFLYLTI